MMKVLAISGSLRAGSNTTAVLLGAARLAAPAIEVDRYGGLSALPHFDPDLDAAGAPAAVEALRRDVAAADAVLFCTPEYAHGVPGSLKNALDWLVGSGELYAKPVALLNAAPRATHAQASLAETLRTMGAQLLTDPCVIAASAGLLPDGSNVEELAALRDALRGVLEALRGAAVRGGS